MIIQLIQSLYDPLIPLPDDGHFYRQALEDIEFFSLSPQIYTLLKQKEQFNQTPLFFQDQLKLKYRDALYQNIFINNQTEQLLQKFEDQGIGVIPLKGVFFAKKYFGHIGARTTSDIDLLINKQDVEKVIQIVTSLGYTTEEERIPSHFHWSFSKQLPNSPIPLTVELHWDILKENTSKFNVQEFWDQANTVKPYQYVKELSDLHTFYMICLHGWKHNMNSLKYFIDIIQMIYVLHDHLDYSMLLREATSHKTYKRILRTLTIVYSLFPQLENICKYPLHKKESIWWEYQSIRDPNYKTYRQYLNLLSFTFGDFDKLSHSLLALLRWLIPTEIELGFELRSSDRTRQFVKYGKLYKKRGLNGLQTIVSGISRRYDGSYPNNQYIYKKGK